MKVIKIVCEYDLGLDDKVYINQKLATRDAFEALNKMGESGSDMMEDELLSFDELEVVDK